MRVAYIGGCGRLGSAMAAHAAVCGCKVYIADLDEAAILSMSERSFRSSEPLVTELLADNIDKILLTTTQVAARCAELIRVIVPTPSLSSGEFFSGHVEEACREIARGLVDSEFEYPVVEIVSTVMPGDTKGPILEALESTGLKAGEDFGLVYSPEFVRQGTIIKDFSEPDMVLIGEFDARSGDVVEGFYHCVLASRFGYMPPPFNRMSILDAEITKLSTNVAVTTKAALANQIAMYCHKMPGADARVVLGAVGDDSRIGHKYFNPGAWVTGPCFPRDLRALARAIQAVTPSCLPDEVEWFNNHAMPEWIVKLVADIAPKSANIGILGLAYKPGVSMTDESQGLYLAGELEKMGYAVSTHDPMAWDPKPWRQIDKLRDIVHICNFLVIMTPWDEYFDLVEWDLGDRTVLDLWGMFNDNELECGRYIRFGRGT